jgi:hypothetical protein
MEEACHEVFSPPLVCPGCGWIATCHFNGAKIWRPGIFFASFSKSGRLPNTEHFIKEWCDWCQQRSQSDQGVITTTE